MLAAVALILAAFAVAWWRAEPMVRRWLATQERAAGLGPDSAEAAEAALRRRGVPMPLLTLCHAESEPWAREQAMQAMLEDYEKVAASGDAGPRAWSTVAGLWMHRELQGLAPGLRS